MHTADATVLCTSQTFDSPSALAVSTKPPSGLTCTSATSSSWSSKVSEQVMKAAARRSLSLACDVSGDEAAACGLSSSFSVRPPLAFTGARISPSAPGFTASKASRRWSAKARYASLSFSSCWRSSRSRCASCLQKAACSSGLLPSSCASRVSDMRVLERGAMLAHCGHARRWVPSRTFCLRRKKPLRFVPHTSSTRCSEG
mmetsp:Transcript_5217/g.20752  ORF Transcript_5217/g.20752 Transcript_5217/m.20752 type:complete len:201 (+) Transcript_5217:1230-1832(+)